MVVQFISYVRSEEERFTDYCVGLTAYNRYDVRFTLDGISLTINNMIITKRKTMTLSRRVQSAASSVRIPQNIGRSLLLTINITPLKLSSVSSIRLNAASNCNIFCNSLRIRLSPVKSPIIRKYKIGQKT